jgi:Glycosyl hydrolases family 25
MLSRLSVSRRPRRWACVCTVDGPDLSGAIPVWWMCVEELEYVVQSNGEMVVPDRPLTERRKDASRVDVSTYQPGWTPAQNDKFVFVKSTEGSTWTSGQAAAQLKAARDKRLQVGHYHFMRPGNAVRQARWFVAKTDIKLGDLLVCDWENTPEGHPSVTDARDSSPKSSGCGRTTGPGCTAISRRGRTPR